MEERAKCAEQHISELQQSGKTLTSSYLEYVSNYILAAMPKEERKRREILTDNRLVTINKHETSFEGLTSKFETGEDGVYQLMSAEQNHLLAPKISITDSDIAQIPELLNMRDAIESLKTQAQDATGKRRYSLKRQIIELSRDQYALKLSHLQPTTATPAPNTIGANKIDLYEERWIDSEGNPQSRGLITFFNPNHISAILCNYEGLRKQTRGSYQDDFYYLLEDFDILMERALAPYPMYRAIVRLKMDEVTNAQIQEILMRDFNTFHTPEYISNLWRHKIPSVIAEQEKRDYLIWYYTNIDKDARHWKKCSRCGQIKVAHSYFFSKNSTAKDKFYSMCKDCRNNKNKGGKI